VTAAAAWAAAVVVAAPDPVGPPAGTVRLVHFEMPTFPLSLDPEPAGLRPSFDGGSDGASIADYHDADGSDGFTLYIGAHEPGGSPDEGAPGYDVRSVDDVSVSGRDHELIRYVRDWCTDDAGQVCDSRSFAWLSWERMDDQWVSILANGSYSEPARVVAIAESLVDRPQPATLSVGLAPEGWSVQSFKMGRVLTLVNDGYEPQTMNVHIPLVEDVIPADEVRESVMGPVGPQRDVTVNGRPAQLVLCESGYLGERIWYLQAQFEDGTTFVLQVPDSFTEDQVLQLAETVTYNP
jgi:hypothetical protein